MQVRAFHSSAEMPPCHGLASAETAWGPPLLAEAADCQQHVLRPSLTDLTAESRQSSAKPRAHSQAGHIKPSRHSKGEDDQPSDSLQPSHSLAFPRMCCSYIKAAD